MDDWDEYQPAQAIGCSWCGERLGPWRGWDGPVRRLVWREGERHPIGARAGSDPPADCSDAILPAAFVISARCEAGHVQHADCFAPAGVWTDTVPIGEQIRDGDYQPEYVLDYGLPSIDPLVIGPGETAPLAFLATGRLGAVLYLSRRSPADAGEDNDIDWMWEMELSERGPDADRRESDWNWDPWPDPTTELMDKGPTLLLSDVRGLEAPHQAQYVVGGMATAGVEAVEIRSATDRRQVVVNRNRAFLLELPDVRTSLTLAALDSNGEVITGPTGSLTISFTVPHGDARHGETWTTIGVLPPVLRA